MAAHKPFPPMSKVGAPKKSKHAHHHPKTRRPKAGVMNGRVPGPARKLTPAPAIQDGTMCRMDSPVPTYGYEEPQWCAAPAPSAAAIATKREVDKILADIDAVDGLKGCAVILQFPGNDPLRLREADHASGLDTYVVVTVTPEPDKPPAVQKQSWWGKWNGVILNCGGAAVSWGGVAVGAAAELPTGGASTGLVVVSYVSATATTAQCGLAVAVVSSKDFAEYVQGPDGKWVNTADVVLDVIGLAGGVAGAVSAVKSGSTLLKTSKYAAALEGIPKGQILKQLEKLEKAGKDMAYFRQMFDDAVRLEKVADPAKRVISNNLIKRALPLITKHLSNQIMESLASTIGVSLSALSSSYGGSGSKGLGVVKVTIQVLQQSIAGTPTPKQ